MGLWNIHGSPNLGQKTRPYNNKKKRICKIVDFVVPTDHRIKLKEFEKKDKYLNLVRELKKVWNMKVTIIQIVIGAFGTVTKRVVKGTGGLGSWRTSGNHPNESITENGQNTEKSPGELEETCGHSNSSEKLSANADVKNCLK